MRTLGTHKLLHPIVLITKDAATGEEKETELRPAGHCVVVRRPKAKDLKVFDDYADRDVEGSMVLLERVSNLDQVEIDNLDADDFGELGNLLGGKRISGKAGKTPSET